jgi:hypothetical protein
MSPKDGEDGFVDVESTEFPFRIPRKRLALGREDNPPTLTRGEGVSNAPLNKLEVGALTLKSTPGLVGKMFSLSTLVT